MFILILVWAGACIPFKVQTRMLLGGEFRSVSATPRALRFVLLLTLSFLMLAKAADAASPQLTTPNVSITVDAGSQYQTLQGFGIADPNSLNYPGQVLNDQLRAVGIDKAFRQIGLNMGTLGSLLESPGSYDERKNDNNDPFITNWDGFNADSLTLTKKFIADLARPYGFSGYFLGGEAPNVRWASPWLASIRRADYGAFLDEAAEQVVANLSWWKNTYQEDLPYYQFGSEQGTGNMASINPDLSGFGPLDPVSQLVDLARRAGARVRAAGFATRFVVGTEETVADSYKVAAAILGDSQARSYVGAIGYHSYPYSQGYSSVPFILATSGMGNPDPGEIAIRTKLRDLAQRNGVAVWMTENSNAGDPLSYDDFRARAIQIHDEFLYAGASAYFGEASMWDLASQRGHFSDSDLYGQGNEGNVVLINNDTGAVDITGIGYAIGHYARWTAPGAVRIDAGSSDRLVQATAFRNDHTGMLSLILINNSGDTATTSVALKGTSVRGVFSGEQSSSSGYWVPLGGVSQDNDSTFHLVLPPLSLTSVAVAMSTAASTSIRIVSAATFNGTIVADSSIATALLPGLPILTTVAPALPLPLSIGGATLTLRDSAGTATSAPLFFVSSNQVNFQVPPGMAIGPASLVLTYAGGPNYTGAFSVGRIAPALFSANANGTGVAAAQLQRVHSDGKQSLDPVFSCGAAPGSCRSSLLDLSGTGGDRTYLILYGTGIRNRTGLPRVRVTIGGQEAQVLYAGPHPSLPGLDQVNVVTPTITGPGDKYLVLTVDGQAANVVTIGVR